MESKKLLIIYGAMETGGIETFFCRLSEERKNNNLQTKILLHYYKANKESELYRRISKSAEIFHFDDIFNVKTDIKKRLPLLNNLSESKISTLLRDVNHIHVTCPNDVVNAFYLTKKIKKKIKITVGFYSHLEFVWHNKIFNYHSDFEKKLIFEILPKENIFTFSKSSRTECSRRLGVDLSKSQTFPLGVTTLSSSLNKKYSRLSSLKLCSVGRLVGFKTYNSCMIDVVSSLVNEGFAVTYHIYGSGDDLIKLRDKVDYLSLHDYVKFMGSLPYEKFDSTVLEYDIFIGSGTAVIQSASLGIISIVATDNNIDSTSYGIFNEIPDIDWNIVGQGEMFAFKNLILRILEMTEDELRYISENHAKKSLKYSMISCLQSFENLGGIVNVADLDFQPKRYEFSRAAYRLISKAFPHAFRYKNF